MVEVIGQKSLLTFILWIHGISTPEIPGEPNDKISDYYTIATE